MESLEERRLLACDLFDPDDLFGAGGALDELQNVIDQVAFVGQQIPFVGDQLEDTVPFGADIRQELHTAYASGAGAIHDLINSTLNDVLGPTGHDLLQQAVDVQFDSDACTITATIDMFRTLATWQTPGLHFDVGLESLPFYATGDFDGIELEMGFDLTPFTVSIDLNSGQVQLDTDGTSFSFELNASLADDAALSAQVGFLHMQISDGLGELPADDERSNLQFGVGIDFAPNFSVDSTQFTGNAELLLHMQTEVNENLPSIAADFILQYDMTNDQPPEVRFDNVSIALGDMVNKFLGPIINVVEPIIEPLDFATDLLSAPIPLISDLGLGDVSVLQIANALADGGALPPDITVYVKLADAVAQIINFVAMLEGPDCVAAGCSDALINLGQLSLSDANGDLRTIDPKTLEPDLYDVSISKLSIGQFGDISTLIDKVDGLPIDGAVKQSLVNSLQNVQDQLDNGVSIEFPIIKNPANLVFQWLVGQNADVFHVDAGVTLGESDVDLSGPMPVGINGGLRGGFAPSIHLGLGYDTFGLRRYLDNVRHDTGPSAADFLEGFYITGDSELSIEGFLEAYLELTALVFSADFSGGVRASLLAEVVDSSEDPSLPNVDNDHNKVRFASEMDACAFRVAGDVHAGIALTTRLGIKLGSLFVGVEHRFDIANAEIVSFDTSCIGNPFKPPEDHILGEVDDNGVLTLYTGVLRDQRSIETTALDEDFSLVPASPDPDAPPGPGQSVKINAFGVSQIVHNVTQIMADMGSGTDKLTVAEGITLDVQVHGGTGNDLLRSYGSGTATFYGDDGDDTLLGGEGENLLFGGDGMDMITGIGNPAAPITIEGGDGDDIIFGGLGDNTIDGGAGHDQIVAGPGTNHLSGGAGDDQIIAGPGTNTVFGGDGNDTIAAAEGPLDADGGEGDDVVAWSFGHGPVTFDGGLGYDALGMIGSSQVDTFVLTNQDGAVRVMGPGPAGIVPTLNINVESVSVDGLAGEDQILVQPLTGTPVERVAINLSDNLDADNVEDVISIHGTPIGDELTVETVDVTLSDLPAHKADSRGGVMRIAGFRQDPVSVDGHYEILAMNQSDRILVNSHDANDLITVRGVTGPTWINTESGDDDVLVSAAVPPDFGEDTGDYLSAFHVDAGSGSNRFAVTESLTFIDDTIEVTDRSVASMLLPGVTYESSDGGSFGQGIQIVAGEHDDTINIASTRRGAVTTVDANDGQDDVNVSSEFVLPGGNLDAIRGNLVIDGGAGSATIALVDTTDADSSPLTTIESTTIGPLDGVQVTGLAGPNDEVLIKVVDHATDLLRLETSNRPLAYESFLVLDTIQGETIINDQEGDAQYRIEVTSGPLDIVGQAGDEVIQVTPTSQSWGDMIGSLTIEAGSGEDRLEISDQSTLELTFYELTADTLARGPAFLGSVAFDEGLELIELDTAGGSDTVNVFALPAATSVHIDQGTGSNAIVAPASGGEWIVSGPDAGSLQGQIHFTHTATIASSGGPSTFSILDGGSVSGSIVGSPAGHDVLDYSDYSSPVTIDLEAQAATQVAGFQYLDQFIGGDADDTLIGRSAVNIWGVSGPGEGSVQTIGDAAARDFSSIEHLVGGDSADQFSVTPAGSINSISGSAGTDQVDYSSFLTAVEVDLQLGTATQIGEIQQIENARGGSGDDILWGNDLNNILWGEGGHDILIGRDGHDTLHGQAGNDLLIGGDGADALSGGDQSDLLIGNATVHDDQREDLILLQAEWKRQDLSYGRRIRNLRDGTGLNARLQLVSASILPDLAIDQLFGGPDDDWFWTDDLDVVLGLEPGEREN